MRYLKYLMVMFFTGLVSLVFCQEHTRKERVEKRHDRYKKHHQAVETHHNNTLIFNFGYTHIPKGAELHDPNAEGFFVPSLGIDYARRIHPKWELGVMLDLELDHYLIYHKEYEREMAFIAVAGAGYNLDKHTILFTGAGIELEQNKNLFVYRIGIERVFKLHENWFISPSFLYDWKKDYSTYSLSIGFGLHF